MRILIIGATGNCGIALTRMALGRGHHVTAFVRNEAKLIAQLGPLAGSDLLHVCKGQLSDLTLLGDCMSGQDAVVAAAGNVADEGSFVPLVHSIIGLAEHALGPDGRFWFFGGAAALDVPGMRVRAAELPLIPKRYVQHLENLARIETSPLDWSMLCPGPMVDSPTGEPHSGLRISADIWPVEGPGTGKLFRTARILKAFRQRMPEMIVYYEDAAQVILDNLDRSGPFSRKRVGVALPIGMTGYKKM